MEKVAKWIYILLDSLIGLVLPAMEVVYAIAGVRFNVKERLSSIKLVAAGCLLLALLPGSASSASEVTISPQPARPSATQRTGPTDPAELEAFLDTFFPDQMDAAHIPGAVVVFVKDGQIFLTKGYGLANVEKGTSVDPERTVFRAGSISKLFTATAVMQLAEQGRLDLHNPVNHYLQAFQLEDAYPEPVTIAHLLTHTGGFDEQAAGMSVRDSSAVLPLGEYLAIKMPPSIAPPGDQINYSNHGFALAGYLVETVSGMPYAQYMAENILRPLDMNHSTFEEPAPASLMTDMAVGYAYVNGAYQPLPLDYFNTAPASSLYTTGTDMARFMIAHLQNGQYRGSRILTEESAQEMHRQQFTHHPGLNGWAYGFFERSANGRRAIAHGGDVPGFASLLYLLPDENLGFFVALNASVDLFGGSPDPREALVSRFLDRYYPAPEPPAAPKAVTFDLQRFAGSYRWNHYAHTTLEKGLPPISLLQFQITPGSDGTLTLTPPPGMGETSRWTPVEPLLFRRVDGEAYIAFREDENGRITHLFLTLLEMPAAAEKVAWYETGGFQMMLVGFFVLTFLSVLAWPAASLFRRLRKRSASFPRPAQQARALAAVVAALNLIFLIGLIGRMGQLSVNVFSAIPTWFVGLLAIPLLTAALTVGLLLLAARAWREEYWSFAGRVHYSLFALAALVFVWFVNYWNLLGWRF